MRRYEHPRTEAEFMLAIEENDDWDNTTFDEDGNAILRVGEKEEDEVFIATPMRKHRPAKVILREDSDPGRSFPQVVRDVSIKRDGPKRHASRVAAAEWAMIAAYMGLEDGALEWSSDENQRAAFRAIAEFETHGIGGSEGFQGGATCRMSWASRLGKGRKHARDGGTWDAAIGDAFEGFIDSDLDESGYKANPEAAMSAVELLKDGLDPLFAACYALKRAMWGFECNRNVDARTSEAAASEAHEWVKIFEAAAAKVTDEFAPFDRVWWSFPRRGDGSDPLETMETVDYQPEECIPMASGPGPIVEILSRRGTLEGGE